MTVYCTELNFDPLKSQMTAKGDFMLGVEDERYNLCSFERSERKMKAILRDKINGHRLAIYAK